MPHVLIDWLMSLKNKNARTVPLRGQLSHHCDSGVTILEIIVVIVCFTILTILVVPAIGRSRTKSFDVQSLANLRTHIQAIGVYASDFNDQYPIHLPPTDENYFTIHYSWPSLLAERYLGVPSNSAIFFHPQTGRSRAGLDDEMPPIYYQMSCSLYASAKYWRVLDRDQTTSEVVVQPTVSVVFPAAKVVIFEPAPALLQLMDLGPSRVFPGLAFADGSARRYSWSSLARGELGDGEFYAAARIYHDGAFPWPLHTTGGIEGRDVSP